MKLSYLPKAPIPLCRSRHDLAIFSGRAGSGKNLADLEQIRCSNALRTLYLRLARVRYTLNTIIGIMSMTSGAQVTLQNDITTLFARCCRCDPIYVRSIRPNHAVPPVLGYEVPGEQIPIYLYPIANSARIA